jgi:hypothetical protein
MKILRWMTPVVAAALAAGGDAFQEGLRLQRAGKYKEALEAWRLAESEAGDDPSAELLFNKALCAFQAGDPHEAEASAEKAAASGRPEFVRGRDFLRGNIEFQRCESLERDIDAAWNAQNAPPAPGAAPPSIDLEMYDRAIAQAQLARDSWAAAAGRAGTPESAAPAVRNAERAVVKIEELKKKKEEAEKMKKEQAEKNKDQKKDDKNKDSQKPESRPESRPQDGSESRPESQPSEDKDKKDSQPKDDSKGSENSKDPQNKSDDSKSQPEERKPGDESKEPGKLTQEQITRMLDKVNEKEKQRQQLMKARARVIRVPKDW